MDTIKLEVTENAYASAKEAKAAGRIPMAYYGKGVDNKSMSIDYQDFRRAYDKGGRSTILTLTNEKGEEFPVLVQDIQYHPKSDDMIHIDVMAVDTKKPIKTSISLVLVGEAPAVKELAGVLMQNKESVEVECLPNDLVHDIEVDISSLVDFHSSINVGDIKAPEKITILDAPEINVATVSAPRAAVEEGAEEDGAQEGGESAEGGVQEGGESAKENNEG